MGVSMMNENQKAPRWTFPVHFASYKVLRVYLMAMVLVVLGDLTNAKNYFANREIRSCVCDGDYDANTDYFPTKVYPELSAYWNVTYHKNYKVVTDSQGVTTYLYLCGTPAPDVETNETTQVVSIPVKAVGVDSSTNFAFFEYINQRTSLMYYVSSWGYITDDCLIELYEAGELYDSTTITEANQDVDFVFYSSSYTSFDTSIPHYYTKASSEDDPLASFEWIKFFSLFFNREQAAQDVYDAVTARYNCTVDEVDDQIASEEASNGKTKMAAFSIDRVSNYTTQYVSPITSDDCSELTNDTIVSQYYIRESGTVDYELMMAAGAELTTELYTMGAANGNNLDNITLGQLLTAAADAEVFLYEAFFEYIDPKCRDRVLYFLNFTKAGRAGNVYDYGRVLSSDEAGTAWFGAKTGEPDVVLRDFVSALYPDLLTNYSRQFLRKYLEPNADSTTIASADSCTDVNAPLYTGWLTTPCADEGEAVEIQGIDSVSEDDTCSTSSPTAPSAAAFQGPSALLAVVFAAVIRVFA